MIFVYKLFFFDQYVKSCLEHLKFIVVNWVVSIIFYGISLFSPLRYSKPAVPKLCSAEPLGLRNGFPRAPFVTTQKFNNFEIV